MKNDEFIEFIKCNNNDLRFKIKTKLKIRYINFIIIKFANYDFYCIFINYI